MAQIASQIKRGFLRRLYKSSVGTGASFSDVLDAFQSNGYEAIKTGRLLTSTAGNSYSVSFQSGGVSAHFTEDECFAMSEEFIELYEYVISQQTLADDAAIFNAMMASDQIASVTQTQNDYTLTRAWASGGTYNQ